MQNTYNYNIKLQETTALEQKRCGSLHCEGGIDI